MKSILLPSAMVLAQAQDYKIKLDESNKLKVIQITDIHYGENEKDDVKTTAEMKKLIDWEKPDLAILTGDMVSNYAWDGVTKPWYEVQWNKWTQAFIEKDLRYMYVQGNHDALADLDRDEVAALDM
jgi:predicted MPP superfamily phosphohydrolase